MNTPFRKFALLFTGILLCAVFCTVATACPTCKEALSEGDLAGRKMAEGFFYSILFMMSMPFAILGTFGGAAYFSIRRARKQQENDLQG